MVSVLFAICPAPWQKCLSAASPSSAPRAASGQVRQWWKQQDSWTSQLPAPALWAFLSAERNRAHLPAIFGEEVKRKSNGSAKCQVSLCLDYLCHRLGHDLWWSSVGSAGWSNPLFCLAFLEIGCFTVLAPKLGLDRALFFLCLKCDSSFFTKIAHESFFHIQSVHFRKRCSYVYPFPLGM